MSKNSIYIGNVEANFNENEIEGNFVSVENEIFYKISNSNTMRPFFMSIVSDSNHWMFISSNGGLTVGRKDCDLAFFPYYTDDKITEGAEITGSKTILLIDKEDKLMLWEPFSNKYEGVYTIQRNLYKNSIGNKIMFEEENIDLGLTFRYQWNTSNLFGFVKKTSIQNNTHQKIKVKILDGIQNIVPYGVNSNLQNEKSNLVDAYKKNELEASVGLGIYSLSAIIVDKAEPSEALKATIAWSIGLESSTHLISSLQLNNFRKGINLKQEIDVRAEKGAYFISSEITVEAKSEKKWIVGGNVNQGPSDIIHISEKLKSKDKFYNEVLKNIELGTENLIELTGSADGIQLTSDKLQNTRHFANTLFNCMRGGIFNENYTIDKSDFTKYILKANKTVFKNSTNQLNQFSEKFSLNKLKEITLKSTDVHFIRLCLEYMPLKFSRRHGDPSRPWNKFSINTQSEIDGSNILDYQGNWRDIFQNWEALAISYPEFIESMIFKFLNASTFEGYNPYRVTKDGFDWEVIEPNDPWSFIGYWGDHQIIYLLKFLEFAENHYPNKLANYFNQELFVYANVPYKIKNYSDILKNSKDTIEFDIDLDKKIKAKKIEIGADGALLLNKENEIHTVNLIEKLLATVLAKFSNFIPEGGIWLNTQRPEWNDANNALVGNGVSMVTLYYLRRFLIFFQQVVEKSTLVETKISEELTVFFNGILETLTKNKRLLNENISDKNRKIILDGLGTAGSNFRNTIYKNGFSTKKKAISKNDLLNFIKVALAFIDHSIEANKRKDNLFNAYNLMIIENENEISISNLPEMLEGQVAVLSAGFLPASESLTVLNSLRNSALFREDQYSYLLYPNKELSRFVNKNNIPSKKIENSVLLRQLLKDGNFQIIEKDDLENFHFNGNFNNVNSLKNGLTNLPEKYRPLVEQDEELLLSIFESVFNHKHFTGRSGTFFGYEGLGSIYWHMVSKLALAVQECCVRAIEMDEDETIIKNLIDFYYQITEGIGVHKSPVLYGAFPTDPYSHTPAGKGAQQPGMTGQVKEDVLCRFVELGVFVKNGTLQFKPDLLKKDAFLQASEAFKYTNIKQQYKEIYLEKNTLCFTYCQVPIVYFLSNKNQVKVFYNNNKESQIDGLTLDTRITKQLIERTGTITQLNVFINSIFFKSIK